MEALMMLASVATKEWEKLIKLKGNDHLAPNLNLHPPGFRSPRKRRCTPIDVAKLFPCLYGLPQPSRIGHSNPKKAKYSTDVGLLPSTTTTQYISRNWGRELQRCPGIHHNIDEAGPSYTKGINFDNSSLCLATPLLPSPPNTKEKNKLIIRIIPPNSSNTKRALEKVATTPEQPRPKRTRPPPPPEQPSDPPDLPEKFRQKIQEINGYDIKFVLLKRIYFTDLSADQGRFTMPKSQCTSLSKNDLDLIKNDTPVSVIQPSDGELQVKRLKFTKWNSTRCYILKGGWSNFVSSIDVEKPLKDGDCFHVWYFKLPPSPCSPTHGFALDLYSTK